MAIAGLDEKLQEIERQRRDGRIGLRCIDTNVLINNEYAIQILSGNLSLVPGYEDETRNPMAARMLGKFDKKPHDILIPFQVITELNKKKEDIEDFDAQFGARRALNAIHGLQSDNIEQLHEYFSVVHEPKSDYVSNTHINDTPYIKRILSENSFIKNFIRKPTPTGSMLANDILAGKFGIVLPNGANVYYKDISSEEFNRMFDSASKINNKYSDGDMIIISSIIKFLEGHPEYKRAKFITDDTGASVAAQLMGVEPEPFRFDSVRNPLQQNRGIAAVEISHDNLVKLRQYPDVDIASNDLGFRVSREFLRPNQIIRFVEKEDGNGDTSEVGRDKTPEKHHFMIYKPNSNILRKLDYYEEFIEFFKTNCVSTGSRSRKEVKIPERCSPELAYKLIETLKDEGTMGEIAYLAYKRDIDSFGEKFEKGGKGLKRIEQRLGGLCKAIEREYLSKDEEFTDKLLTRPFNQRFSPDGEQIPYLDHLLNPDITVLSIDAAGGFGKTYWAMAAGLFMVHKGIYKKILYVKPMETNDTDIGALPGEKQAKIYEKTRSARAILSELFCSNDARTLAAQQDIEKYITALERSRKIEFDVISDFSGLNIPGLYAIIDEFHYFNRDQAGLILGRFHDSSKMVALSAIEQLHSGTKRKYLNERNAGITHMADKLTDFPAYAHISASEQEIYRSEAAKMAATILKRRFY